MDQEKTQSMTNSSNDAAKITKQTSMLSSYTEDFPNNNLNLSYNPHSDRKHFINSDSPLLKTSQSHKRRHFKVDIGNIVNEELNEDDSEICNQKDSSLSPKTKLLIYNLKANPINSKRKIVFSEKKKKSIGHSIKNVLSNFEDYFDQDESMSFDDNLNLDDDYDEMRLDNFDLDNSICNEIEKNNNNYNKFDLEFGDKFSFRDECKINNNNANNCIINSSYYKIDNVPTILGRILKQEAEGNITQTNQHFC